MDLQTGHSVKSWQNTQPLAERAVQSGPFAEETGFRLLFEATCSQPDFAKLFLSSGGSLNTAAGAGATDFAVTGSTASVNARLSNKPFTVIVELPESMVKTIKDGALHIDVGSKLNISSQRVGAAITGTLVDTFAGAGSVYLQTILSPSCRHVQVPCVYGNLASHSCNVGISGARIEDYSGEEVDIVFTKHDARQSLLARAEKLVDAWAQSSWDFRQKAKYKLSPNLTKSVAKVPVGINDRGYDLVHNILDQDFPFSTASLNSLFEHAIALELGYDDGYVANFLKETANPGIRAASWAQTVASACSIMACYLVSYRADGKTVVVATGSAFGAQESWLRAAMRTPCEGNDCDGTGLLVNAMLKHAIEADAETLRNYPYLNAVKNAIHPYYIHGITVVAATSAEASSGGGEGEHVAGHALALLIPTLSFLTGLQIGVQDMELEESELQETRFKAVFSPEVLSTLPKEESDILSSGNLTAWEAIQDLRPFAIEGTTPAAPVLYIADPVLREEATQEARRDAAVFAAASPNVARGLKSLHVGGRRKADPHRFYRDFLEFSIDPSHPLYSDTALRDQGAAASQFVFVRPNMKLTVAGASPRQLALGDFGLHPMCSIDTKQAMILDFASEAAKEDVLPPRAGSFVLTAAQSSALRESVQHLRDLDHSLEETDCKGHCVAYILPFSVMANSPRAVMHFVKRIASTTKAGAVNIQEVADLAVHADGESAGVFVSVNIVV